MTKTKHLTLLSFFIAIEILLGCVPFLGFIPIGPLRATTLHIPVIIAGIILGRKDGAYVGLTFGFISLIKNTLEPTVTSFVFSPFISGSLMSLCVVLIPRVLLGYFSGLFYDLLKKHNESFAMIFSGLVSTLLHTLMVMLSIYFIFGESYASAIGKSLKELMPYIYTIVTTQGVLEACVGTVIAFLVCRVLKVVYKG